MSLRSSCTGSSCTASTACCPKSGATDSGSSSTSRWRRVRAGAGDGRDRDAVDYRDVVATVREVSDGRAYHLLEAFAAALADVAARAIPARRGPVRVRKPDVLLDPPVDTPASSSSGEPT